MIVSDNATKTGAKEEKVVKAYGKNYLDPVNLTDNRKDKNEMIDRYLKRLQRVIDLYLTRLRWAWRVTQMIVIEARLKSMIRKKKDKHEKLHKGLWKDDANYWHKNVAIRTLKI